MFKVISSLINNKNKSETQENNDEIRSAIRET